MKFLLFCTLSILCVKCQEEVFILDPPTSPEEQQGGFSSHIVALRPDYTFWKMVNVLKNVFDSRTTEKRRGPSRRDAEEMPVTKLPNLRSRRLLLNFGRYRI
uniref:NmN-125 n=1 Tax=Caenorhabditis tropicalis TaxID=1561998 RepID=A0A1I7T4E0_9PELO